MTISEKLAAIAGSYDPNAKPLVVTRQWRIFIKTFECNLWVVDEGDWWRVMLSKKRRPFLGADFRKDSSVVGDGPITWKYEKKWELSHPSESQGIQERIEAAVNLAYAQYADRATPT